MSGETEQNVSGWTTDTLRSYFQRQLDDRATLLDERFSAQSKAIEAAFVAQDKATQAALAAAEKAVSKAETAADKRFDAVNEFRGQLSDQANLFIPRTEAQAVFSQLEKEVQELKDRINGSAGESRGSQISKANFYAALAAVGGILGIVVLLANNVFK